MQIHQQPQAQTTVPPQETSKDSVADKLRGEKNASNYNSKSQVKQDTIPEPEGGDSEKFPSTVTNKLLPPHMVEQSRELGLKEFTINDLDGNPEYYLKFSNGSWQDRCMIHGEWL